MPATFKPRKQTAESLEYSDRLKRIIRAHESVYQEYVPNKMEDRNEILTLFNSKRYPQSVRKFLGGIYRVILPQANMFELDAKTGRLDKEFKVKQAIVYRLNQYVENPDRPMEQVASCNMKLGTYQRPVARLEYDTEGNVKNSVRVGSKNIFYIPYSPKLIKDLIEESGNTPTITCVTVGMDSGSEFHTPHPIAIPNINEFIEVEDLYGLIEASRRGYLMDDYGGYNRFKEDKKLALQTPHPLDSKDDNKITKLRKQAPVDLKKPDQQFVSVQTGIEAAAAAEQEQRQNV